MMVTCRQLHVGRRRPRVPVNPSFGRHMVKHQLVEGLHDVCCFSCLQSWRVESQPVLGTGTKPKNIVCHSWQCGILCRCLNEVLEEFAQLIGTCFQHPRVDAIQSGCLSRVDPPQLSPHLIVRDAMAGVREGGKGGAAVTRLPLYGM